MTTAILLTTAEAAARKGTTVRQIQRLAAAGVLPIAKRGPRNTLFFKASDVRVAPTSLR